MSERINLVENRTYLWIKLVFKDLEGLLSNVSKDNIEEIINDLPTGIDDIYERILGRVSDQMQARFLLSCLLAAKRVLTVSDVSIILEYMDRMCKDNAFKKTMLWQPPLAWVGPSLQILKEKCLSSSPQSGSEQDALILRTRTERRLTELCGLLVVVASGRVFLLHQTVREFLVGALALEQVGRFHIRQQLDSSTDAVLQKFAWKQSIDLSRADALLAFITTHIAMMYADSSNDKLTKDPNLVSHYKYDKEAGTFALTVDYACRHWSAHYRGAEETWRVALLDFARRLCRARNKTWITRSFFDHGWHDYGGLPELHIIAATGIAELLPPAIPQSSLNRVHHEAGTPLWCASHQGHAAMVRRLLDIGANPERKDVDGHIPLFIAVQNGHLPVVEILLAEKEHGVTDQERHMVHRNQKDSAIPEHCDKKGYGLSAQERTLLYQKLLEHAVLRGQTESVRLMLNKIQQLDTEAHMAKMYSKLLITAVTHDLTDMAELLTQVGHIAIDVKYKRRTLLHYAAAARDAPRVAQWLLEKDKTLAESKTTEGLVALHLAVEVGNEKMALFLVKYSRQSLNIRCPDHMTLLHKAVHEGCSAELVESLLQTGLMDVNSTHHGRTPLHMAAANNIMNRDVVKALLADEKIDLSIIDDEGFTALQRAKLSGAGLVEDLIIQALPTRDQSLEETWFKMRYMVVTSHDWQIFEKFLQLPCNKAQVNIVNSAGRTPLHTAIEFDKDICIWVLLQAGAKPYQPDSRQRRPVDIAPESEAGRRLQSYINT